MATPAPLFDLALFGAEVGRILSLDGNGQRLMPLASGVCSSEQARLAIQSQPAAALFSGVVSPQGARAGLFLYFSCLDEAHTEAQELDTAEGSFWHGIMHRQEPDAANAAYWFRRVGSHAVFPALRGAAEAILERWSQVKFAAGERWDPFRFVDFCEAARRKPGSPEEQAALEIQRAEWQLLFAFCAREQRR